MGSPFSLGFQGGGVGISANTNLGSLGFSANINIGTQPIPGQTFRTIPLPNFNPATYGLAIVGSFGGLIGGITFPLSPTALRKDHVAMSNVYDVAGTPAQGGVNRVMDSYGHSPVTFTIEGTTGWQYHSTDGYSQTGLQAIAAIEQFLFQYAQLNAAQAANSQPPYTMEFYDSFRGDYWQVEPWGPQGIRQTNQRPLLVYYLYRFAGIMDLTNPVAAENDQVANVLSGVQTPTGPGGIMDAATDAPSTPIAGTQNLPSGVGIEDLTITPIGVQNSLSGVTQSSANLQANYADVTPGALGGSSF